jgi:hypothetical protein
MSVSACSLRVTCSRHTNKILGSANYSLQTQTNKIQLLPCMVLLIWFLFLFLCVYDVVICVKAFDTEMGNFHCKK